MQLSPYLSFNGECEAAFRFYEECFGGQLGTMFRYAGSPIAHQVPADWSEKVMHGSVTVGGIELMGADVVADIEGGARGFSISIQISSIADAERIFQQLADGGRVTMPLEQTFWAARFGMVVDRFGIPWLMNCAGTDQPAEA